VIILLHHAVEGRIESANQEVAEVDRGEHTL
jgi:hypothetical protein